MSNRYAEGFGHGFCFRNDKHRKWFLDMFNTKMTAIIKRIEKFPDRDIRDILGDNVGLMGGVTKQNLAVAIQLRNARTTGPNEKGEWLEECYAEAARMCGGKMFNCLLVDSVWYVSESFMFRNEYKFVSCCLLYRAQDSDDENLLTDSLVKALIASDMSDDFIEAIREVIPTIDADGIRTVADFEMACG